MSDSSLAGLVVAITGAGQGIGFGLAQAFARQGARLVLSDIDEVAALASAQAAREAGAQVAQEAGASALGIRADVRREDELQAQVDLAFDTWGRLDVMICNAGIMQLRPLLDLEAKDWDQMLGVNVTGVFLSLKTAARRMLTQAPLSDGRPRGKIINIASVAGRPGAGAIASVMAHYRASKAAVISLTQSASFTLAPQVTVNAICPGVVDTGMWALIDREWTDLQGLPRGEAWRQRVAGVPMGRAQTPADVAGLALFLASPAADYMTGQSINIDGGLVLS